MIEKSSVNTGHYKCSACVSKRQICEAMIRQQFESRTLVESCEGPQRNKERLIPVHQEQCDI